jgi:hypothetical protein
MSFDPWSILLSFTAGSIGLVLLMYGKKQARIPHLVWGVLFIVYPYLVPSASWMLAIGAGLGVGLWWVIRLGW